MRIPDLRFAISDLKSASRFVSIFLVIVSASSAFGQSIDQQPQAPTAPPAPSIVAPPNGLQPGLPGQTPYEPSKPPSGFTETPPPTVDITGGVNVPVNNTTLRLDAAIWRVDFEKGNASLVTAKGSVKAIYREFTVTSDAANIDLRTKLATFTGNVVFTAVGQVVKGSFLSLNLDTREWRFESAVSTVTPDRFPGQLQAPIFLSGAVITGLGGKVIDIKSGGFTTCNLEEPHYFLDAKSATVYTDRKLIARDATFIALGRTILKLSRVVIPIRQIRDNPSFLPRVGRTEEEGFFMKAAYAYAASKDNSGDLKLDLMSKKGIGLGVVHDYNLGGANGELNAYWLNDVNRHLNTMTGRFTYKEKFGDISTNFTSDYRANSYQYSPQSTSLSNDLRLIRQVAGMSTTLAIQDSVDNGFGTYNRLSSNLTHNQTFGKHSFGSINLDYFRSESPLFVNGSTITAANAQLTSRLEFRDQIKEVDWALRLAKIDDLSDEAFISQTGGSRFAGTERLPELELTSDTNRLGMELPFKVPAQLGMAVGRYTEDLGVVDESRAMASINVPQQSYKLADRLNLLAGAGFRQYAYSDGTAQYAYDGAVGLARQLGQHSRASLNYRILHPDGFTPFRFDFLGRYNTMTGNIDIQESKKFRASVFTGYNFGQKDFQWQDLTFRATYQPSQRYLIYTSTGYDLNRSQWRALVNQFRVRLPGSFRLDVGSRYDFQTSKFASLKTEIDTPMGKLWHLRGNAGYNGFTKNFDYKNIQLVRDLHCWEMSFAYVDQTGFFPDKGFRLNFRIKAFPMFDRFGVGQFGQGLDTSVGEVL